MTTSIAKDSGRMESTRAFGADSRQDHGDRLGVFVLQIVGQHGLVYVAELVPRCPPNRAADLLHDLRHTLTGQRALKQPFGVLVVADQVPCGAKIVGKLNTDSLNSFGAYGAELRHR